MSFTKGPWRLTHDSVGRNLIGADGVGICRLPRNTKLANANAKLILQSPELLGMLEYLLDECVVIDTKQDSDGEVYDTEILVVSSQEIQEMRELVKKARGE
jgi:hypothetical protein